MLCNLRWVVLNPWWHWTHSDVKRSSIYICFLSVNHCSNNSSRQWLDVVSIWGRGQIPISCSTYNGEERLQTIQWKHTMETSTSWPVGLFSYPFSPPYHDNRRHRCCLNVCCDKKGKRQNDKKTKWQKANMTKIWKGKRTKRQRPKRVFNIVTSGQFRTLAMFFSIRCWR